MALPLLGLLGIGAGILGAGAAAAGAAGMGYWATTNVGQALLISRDKALEREQDQEQYDWQRWRYFDEKAQDDLDYQRSLDQTVLIEAFDQNARNYSAQAQAAGMQFDAQMQEVKMRQLAEDRNLFLQEQAFKGYGIPTESLNRNAIAYILTELYSIQGETTQTDQGSLDHEEMKGRRYFYDEEEDDDSDYEDYGYVEQEF